MVPGRNYANEQRYTVAMQMLRDASQAHCLAPFMAMKTYRRIIMRYKKSDWNCIDLHCDVFRTLSIIMSFNMPRKSYFIYVKTLYSQKAKSKPLKISTAHAFTLSSFLPKSSITCRRFASGVYHRIQTSPVRFYPNQFLKV